MEPGQFVFDKVTGSMGRVKKLHGPGEYVSPANQLPVEDAVLELEGGASFLVEENRFATMTEGAVNECASVSADVLMGLGELVSGVLKKRYRGASDPRMIAKTVSIVLQTFAKDLTKQMEPGA